MDLLLGTDVLALIVPREVVEGPPGTPWAVRTLLGWLVTGHTPQLAVNETTESQVHAAAAAPSRNKRRAAATCANVAAEPGRPPPAVRRRLSQTTDGDVTTDEQQWPAGGQQKEQLLIRLPEKQLCLQRYDQRSMDDLSRGPVPPVTSALQRRSQMRRRFQPPPPPLPTPCRRQRWHRAPWRTSTTTTTCGTTFASMTQNSDVFELDPHGDGFSPIHVSDWVAYTH